MNTSKGAFLKSCVWHAAGVTGRVKKSVNNDAWVLPPGILISLRQRGFFPEVLPRAPRDQQSLGTTGLGDTLNSENLWPLWFNHQSWFLTLRVQIGCGEKGSALVHTARQLPSWRRPHHRDAWPPSSSDSAHKWREGSVPQAKGQKPSCAKCVGWEALRALGQQ